MRNDNHIKSAKWARPARADEVMELLGLGPKAKLPPEGMEERLIQGIPVWVNPLPEPKGPNPWSVSGRAHRRFALRVRARCPQCAKETAASRLAQHTCK